MTSQEKNQDKTQKDHHDLEDKIHLYYQRQILEKGLCIEFFVSVRASILNVYLVKAK